MKKILLLLSFLLIPVSYSNCELGSTNIDNIAKKIFNTYKDNEIILSKINKVLKDNDYSGLYVLKDYISCKYDSLYGVVNELESCKNNGADNFITFGNYKNKRATTWPNDNIPAVGKSIYEQFGSYKKILKESSKSIGDNKLLVNYGSVLVKGNSDIFYDDNQNGLFVPNGWEKFKIYIPKGTLSYSIYGAGRPVYGDTYVNVSYFPDNYSGEKVIDYKNLSKAIENLPYNKEEFETINGNTVNMLNKSNIQIITKHGIGDLLNSKWDVSKSGGWMYIAYANAGKISNKYLNYYNSDKKTVIGDINRENQHSEYWFSAQFVVDEEIFNNWINSLEVDDKGNPLDRNCIKLIDLPKNGVSNHKCRSVELFECGVQCDGISSPNYIDNNGNQWYRDPSGKYRRSETNYNDC